MGLHDRHYMRDEYHPPHLTTKLIVVLIAVFLLQSILVFYFHVQLVEHLGLTLNGFVHGKVWQLITFQFLHAAPWPFHVLFNCLGLYFFGRPVEERYGARKFMLLYLLAGLIGGMLQIGTTAILPNHDDFPVVGASAGICGMIAIFCSLNPMQELTTWIYFFPVTIRARVFLMFLALFSLFGTIIPFDNVANAAHLGGILFGMAYVRWGERWEEALKWRPFPAAGGKRGTTPKPSKIFGADPEPAVRSEDSFISREVDPILDKISQHGIQSLTDEERRVLEAARNKMAKR